MLIRDHAVELTEKEPRKDALNVGTICQAAAEVKTSSIRRDLTQVAAMAGVEPGAVV